MHQFRKCHIQDGAAYATFADKLFRRVVTDREDLSEGDIGTLVDTARKTFKGGILDLSFPSIVGVGENGAIVHYNYNTAPPGVNMGTLTSCKSKAQKDNWSSCVLIDSGAHYEVSR